MKSFFQYLVLLFSLNFIGKTFGEPNESYRCDYKYSATAKGSFKHFVVPANWYDARLRCTLEGSVLASPTTPEIEAEMTEIIKNFFTSDPEIFTGISATVSRGDFFTVDGIRLSEISVDWAENEPDNKNDTENCITFNDVGQLADKPCTETHPYICYRSGKTIKPPTECGTVDSDYYLDSRTNSCYKFHTVPRNFSRAYMACSAEGGHLAIINSQVEAKVLKELFAKYPASKMVGNFWKDVVFIGFHSMEEHMDWRTIHGQTLRRAGYSDFSGGEPNNAPPGERCGGMYRSGRLNDLWCDKPAAFICEKSLEFPAFCKSNNDTNTDEP